MSRAEQIIQQYTQEQIWGKFDLLNGKLQVILLDPRTVDTLEEIAQNNGVPNKSGKIVRYATFILGGIIPITLLRETLEQELNISTESARKIATEIRDKIFMGVAEELRKIHGLNN